MPANEHYVPVGEIDRQIATIEEQLQRLPLELDVLRRIRSQAIELPLNSRHAERGLEKLGPKQAVLRYLAAHRDPKKILLVITAVEPHVDSVSVDVKRTLYSTISNLKKNGLVSAAEGRVAITVAGLQESRKALNRLSENGPTDAAVGPHSALVG